MTEHIRTKQRLKRLTRSEYSRVIEEAMLSPRECKIIDLIYVKNKTLGFIADELGYSEGTIRRDHSNAIVKIGYVFKEKDGQS